MVTTSTENLFIGVLKKAICGCFPLAKTHRFFSFSSVREGCVQQNCRSLVQLVPLRVQFIFSKLLKVCLLPLVLF